MKLMLQGQDLTYTDCSKTLGLILYSYLVVLSLQRPTKCGFRGNRCSVLFSCRYFKIILKIHLHL